MTQEEKLEEMVRVYNKHTEDGYTDPTGVHKLLELLMEEAKESREQLMKSFEEALSE